MFKYSARLATNLKESRYSESDSLSQIRRDIAAAKKRGTFGLVPVNNATGAIVIGVRR